VRFRGAIRFSESGWVTRDNKRAFISTALSVSLPCIVSKNRRRALVRWHSPSQISSRGKFRLALFTNGLTSHPAAL
jgi:hypothetical protein